MAEKPGVDFTTVTRPYAEAARHGLAEGRVGQGTFVPVSHAPAPPVSEPRQAARSADLRMDALPLPAGLDLRDILRRDIGQSVVGWPSLARP